MKSIKIVCFFLFSIQLQSQTIENLKVECDNIYQATVSLNYDAILDATYPKIFEIVPRIDMKALLISTFNGSDGYTIKLLPVKPEFTFGEIIKIENQYFCSVMHNLAMQMTMEEEIEDEEMMVSLFKRTLETNNVTFDKSSNTFTILKRATMIGVFDEFTTKNWKLINKDKNNVLAKKLFSDKVLIELGL